MTLWRKLSIERARIRGWSLVLRIVMLWFLAAGALAPLALAVAPSEYELKAVFLLNFARFVIWPATALSANNGPFIIGIVGEDPFGPILDSTVEGELVNGHEIVVRRFKPSDDITKCHVLYISRSESPRIPVLLNRLRGQAILTVSDSNRFAYAGGMIGLVLDQGKVGVQINIESARKGNLVISAKLLKLSFVINDLPQTMIHDGSRVLCTRFGSAVDKSRAIKPAIGPVAHLSDTKSHLSRAPLLE